jgi:enoyl-CoA hydratase/carnithine racemase
MANTYSGLEVIRSGQVATIGMRPSGDIQYVRGPEDPPPVFFPKHKQLGLALEELRADNSVRVIVLTGLGDVFFVPPSGAPGPKSRHNPGEDWDLTVGLARTLQTFIEIEKPIIARVNGDAIGFGSSLVFASDFIIAAEDAVIADYHLGMGETGYGRSDVGVVPGDGGSVFVPMHMPPAMAKEFLFLARPYTGADLAALGIINRAVPAAELDATVDEFCQRLLLRSSHALGFAKRVVNRRIAANFNLTFDAAWAYEMANFYMHMAGTDERGRSEL